MYTAAMEMTEKEAVKAKTAKPLLWIGIVSIVMIFAGLTSAYVVRSAQGDWNYFDLPVEFYYSTLTILLSSATLIWATASAKNNRIANLKMGMVLTFLLGILFVYFQLEAYSSLVANGIFLGGKGSNASGSFLYVISGMHLLHLFAGLISVLVTLVNSLRGKYNEQNILGLQLCSIYWHFLGGLWIFLLLFLYFIH